ncbi:MAG TPA: hypothetical protein VGP82_01585 [Ktedonobacterales bacterium]|nr:hypothetical protein [Ktedonobacterales bacterium]
MRSVCHGASVEPSFLFSFPGRQGRATSSPTLPYEFRGGRLCCCLTCRLLLRLALGAALLGLDLQCLARFLQLLALLGAGLTSIDRLEDDPSPDGLLTSPSVGALEGAHAIGGDDQPGFFQLPAVQGVRLGGFVEG